MRAGVTKSLKTQEIRHTLPTASLSKWDHAFVGVCQHWRQCLGLWATGQRHVWSLWFGIDIYVDDNRVLQEIKKNIPICSFSLCLFDFSGNSTKFCTPEGVDLTGFDCIWCLCKVAHLWTQHFKFLKIWWFSSLLCKKFWSPNRDSATIKHVLKSLFLLPMTAVHQLACDFNLDKMFVMNACSNLV